MKKYIKLIIAALAVLTLLGGFVEHSSAQQTLNLTVATNTTYTVTPFFVPNSTLDATCTFLQSNGLSSPVLISSTNLQSLYLTKTKEWVTITNADGSTSNIVVCGYLVRPILK